MGNTNNKEVEKYYSPAIKVLGFWFNEEGIDTNLIWRDLMLKSKEKLEIYQNPQISLYNKAKIFKTIVYSRFAYFARLVLFTPAQYRELKKLAANYIWNRKSELLKRDQIFNKIKDGGLNLEKPEDLNRALVTSFTISQLQNNQQTEMNCCKYLFGWGIRHINRNFPVKCQDPPPLYKQVTNNILYLIRDLGVHIDSCVNYKIIVDKFYKPHTPRIYRDSMFPDWEAMYNVKINNEISDLNFKVANNILPVRELLYKFYCTTTESCPRCGDVESQIHLFTGCTKLKVFWRTWHNYFNFKQVTMDHFFNCNLKNLNISKSKQAAYLDVLALTKFTIWKSRNHLLLLKRRYDDRTIFMKFLCNLRDYLFFDYERLNYKKRKAKWNGISRYISFPYGKPQVSFEVLRTLSS